MADKDTKQKDEAGGEAKSGKSKLIVIILGVLVLVAGSVGGTLFFLGFFDPPAPSEEELAAAAVDVKPAAMYFPIKPAFIINFQSRGRQRFLQVDVTVLTRDGEIFSAIQEHLPLIKNKLVMILSGGVYQELQTDEGRELMRQQVHQGVQEIIQTETGKTEGIEQVLFTNFVMQ